MKKFDWEQLAPHRVFLILAVTIGLGVLIANPPFQAADEFEHFFRAFQLSQGQIVSEKQGSTAGGELPAIVNGVASPQDLPFHSDRKVTPQYFIQKSEPGWVDWAHTPSMFISFPHTALYAPLGYLPQTLAIIAGKLLHIGPLGLMYLARLAGFSVCVTLGYFSLRILPIYRRTALVLLVTPLPFYLMGSLAPDGLLITGAMLLIALLIRATLEPSHRLGWKEKSVILALAALLPVSKFVYLPLSALVPWLLFGRLRPGKDRNAFMLAWGMTCILPVWLWGRVIVSTYVLGRTDIYIDPVLQLHAIAAHPFDFLILVGRTVILQADYNYRSLIGVLGWNDTFLPAWFYNAFGWGVLICLMLESGQSFALRWSTRLKLLGAGLSAILLVYVAIYAHWNSPGSKELIDGLVGRYFWPAVPALIFSFPAIIRLKIPVHITTVLGTLLAATSAIVCLISVVVRYYVA